MTSTAPPTSGGTDRTQVELTGRAIDTSALLNFVSGAGQGAALLFLGTVRNHHRGRAVEGLDYSAYETMAIRVMGEIADEAVARADHSAVAVSHRIGSLAVGDVSVAIAVAAPHRDAAYQVSRYVIEELKKRVPIWKREHYMDGTREWVNQNDRPIAAGALEAL